MGRIAGSIWGVLILLTGCVLVLSAGSPTAGAAKIAPLSVTVGGIRPKGVIPGAFAFCIPAKEGHVTFGPNRSPEVRWSRGPAGTASYALIMRDSDAPGVDEINKEGHTIPPKLKRIVFYHWVLVDIPATVTALPAGADSNGVTVGGKAPGPSKYGVRGVNDYTSWFASDPKMAGTYGGYDGPCPPWNDSIAHRYHFTVYALNVPSLKLSGTFTGGDARKAMRTHMLARGEVVGLYTLNPAVSIR